MGERPVRPFGLRDKVGYLLGDLGNDFTFLFASGYIMVFYSKVMGISTGLIGTMFVIARCLDAFTDIGMGRIVDSIGNGRPERFRPWLLRMCGPVALTSFLMYQVGIREWPYMARVIYMFVTYILWGSVFYTSINIPYGSMASVISGDPKHRSSLSVYRSVGSMVAGIAIGAIAPLVVYYTDQNKNQVVSGENFTFLAGILAVCSVFSYVACYFLCAERVVLCKTQNKQEKYSFTESVGVLLQSRALWGVILSALLMLLATLMSQSVNNYLYADYFKNTRALSVSGLIQLPAMLILASFATRLAMQYGKRECGFVGMMLSGILYLLTGFLQLRNVWIFILLIFVAMLGMMFFNMQCYAMVTDVIDDLEVRTGKRDDGTVYGIYSFSRKIGQALAGGVGGWALSWIGYDELAVAQTGDVQQGIYNLATFFPGIVYLLAAGVLFFLYPLGKRRVEDNVEKLKEQHNADEEK